MKLDLKDKKILYELDIDSRQSFHDLSKKVGLSKDAVIYRIENLKKEGIIQKFHTVVDTNKLGLISFRLYLKFQNTTPKKEEEIINWLKNKKNITWIASAEGDYDLAIWILVKSVKEMNILWKELIRKYVNHIEKRWLTIFTKVSYFSRAFLLDKKKNTEEFIFISDSEPIEVDEKDLKLLRLLTEDSRISIVDLSAKLKMTPKTIINRIRQLEEKKIILGYRTMFDLSKLGYQYFKLFFGLHNINLEKEAKFRDFIKIHPNIVYDNEVLGGGDIELDIQVRSLEDFRNLLEEIKQNFSEIIKNYWYMLFYKEHKYIFFPL